MKKYSILLLVLLAACYGESEDEGCRIVPITNNPNIVPNHGGGIPGVPTGGPH